MTGSTTKTDPAAALRRPFDIRGPLPTGTTVLEASAGTGKTFAIVGLAARYVAEGAAELSEMLLVTFSRNATQELRQRTRERFTRTAAALADPESARVSEDPVVAQLAEADDDEVVLRRRRLIQALSDFDAATIATTHSFCDRVLDGLGVAGEREPDAQVVEEADDLISEAIADLYLRGYRHSTTVPFTTAQARVVARTAVRDGQARLAPDDADGTDAGRRVAFAEAVRGEVERRKRASRLRDFDDLPALLRQVLTDPEHGEAACRRVRERYRIVLVDEFQDTDPLQWDIVRSAFHGHGTLILVGDPKQAIYAFRGAEVLSYLEAVTVADAHRELTMNWRSDEALVASLAHLYGGAALGNPQIVVHPVRARHAGTRVAGLPALRLRHLPRTGAGGLGKSGFPTVGRLRSRVADDVAADIARLLGSGQHIDLDGGRAVEPRDIAVLVRKNAQATLVHEALTRCGVPAVLTSGTSVFETEAARHWLWVLRALEQPHRGARVRLAALTTLFGRTAAELAEGGDDVVAEVGGQLRELAEALAGLGFAAMFERLAALGSLESRLLGEPGGERRLTDLRHVAQQLGAVAVRESLGLTAITRWLVERMQDPKSGGSDRTRRLDSDAAAVQIATVHMSKGLEYPLVYVPFGWDGAKWNERETQMLHDDDGRRVLDVGGPAGPGYGRRRLRADEEDAGEELRLLYVALTRAQCAVTMWWAPSYGTKSSPLHRLLFARTAGTADIPLEVVVPEDAKVAEELAGWAAAGPASITVHGVGPRRIESVSWSPPREESTELEAARFTRRLDERWRRTSYSALTAAAHEATAHESSGAGSEPEEPQKTDEPEEPPVDIPEPADSAGALPSPMNDLPAGAAFGTLVHAVLEVVDTSAPDLDAELLRCCREVAAAVLAEVGPEELAAALAPVLRTPLSGAPALAEIAPADRLAELDFELPLAGGDTPSGRVTLPQVARLLREHLPSDDVLVGYADLVETLDPAPLRGFLTGSIDAVLRLRGDTPRFVVVDYKTNRLAMTDELTTAHYTRERMAAEMLRAHYPLQALLYCVALHRYLRWRLPGYDPAVHLGGVQYLFVRGMAGPGTPENCGVFEWTPPPGMITALSDLLSGSEVAS